MLSLWAAIQMRRSIREFSPEDVPDKMIRQMVREMEEAVNKATASVGTAVANQKRLERQVHEKKALVEQSASAVLQALAAIDEAKATILQRQAELEQVKSHRSEKLAMLSLNETKLRDVDLYSPAFDTVDVPLPLLHFEPGINFVFLRVVGKNAASESFGIGLDYLRIAPAGDSRPGGFGS